MLDDRFQRELKAAEIGYDLPWGNFFASLENELNPSQRRAILPAFVEWTQARAARLPETVYLQTNAQGFVPAALQCWTLRPAPKDNARRSVPEALAQALEELSYEKQAIHLETLAAATRNSLHRRPEAAFMIYGRPSLAGTGRVRVDPATGSCARSGGARAEAVESTQWDAIVVVDGAFRMPLERNMTQLYRDIGSATVQRLGPTTLRLDLSTSRTELLDVVGTGGRISVTAKAALTEADLPQPPEQFDVFGISPGDDWGAAEAAARDRLPDARVARGDGPPPNARMVTRNTIIGPMPEFSALRNGHVFLDLGRNEVLAVLREAERDPDRVLAVGSYRRFESGGVTQEQLIGALLRKYGANPATAEDGSLRGPAPAQTLSWGVRAGCLPRMDELRPNWSGMEQDPQLRAAQTLARSFLAPSMTYNGADSVIYARCPPAVWALVGEDGEGVLHLMVWSLDLALLDEIARQPDTSLQADGEEGSQALIENAAEIDL